MNQRRLVAGNGKRSQDVVERLDLRGGERIGWLVSHREMGAHPREPDG